MLTPEEQDWAYEAVKLVREIQLRLDGGAEFKRRGRSDPSGFFVDQKERVERYKTNVRMTSGQMVWLRDIAKTGLIGGIIRKKDRVNVSDSCAEGDHVDCYDRICACECHSKKQVA
jgi:hypothetical protein